MSNPSTLPMSSKRNLLALLVSNVMLTAGCSYAPYPGPADQINSAAILRGNVHGGNQPVIDATVTLWFAGQEPSFPATKGATTTTDRNGSFSFVKDTSGGTHDGTTNTYACPTSVASPLVYVLARGGNTQNNGVVGQSNSAAVFIGLYGSCADLTAANFIFLSEATTVATMAAVQQFFDPANETISADGTEQQRLIMLNLPNTVNLLTNPMTGTAVSSTLVSASAEGDIPQSVSLTATPETAKINTLANILSACINSATSAAPACNTLFSAAVPPPGNVTRLNPTAPFAAATDTLQASFYIFTNPTNSNLTNMANLFALAPAVGQQPMLTAQPTDWTIGIVYTSTSSCGTTGGNFIDAPFDINIDAQDNVWFANSIEGNLTAISSFGAPLTCVFLDASSRAFGGANIDAANNVWFGAGTTMYRYNPLTKVSVAFPVGVSPFGLTADGVGNVYFSTVEDPTMGSVYVLPHAATASSAVAPVQISTTVGPGSIRLLPDATSASPSTVPGNIWVTSGSTFISQLSKSSAPGNLNGWITTAFPTSGNSRGVSVDSGNNVFVSAIDNNAITLLAHSGATWLPAIGFPFTAATAGISSPTAISVDGRSNTWIPNVGQPSVSEISSAGPNPLSPAAGFAKSSAFLNGSAALAVDQAGNVWIAGVGNSAITEIVGAAVPVFQPYSVGIKTGRFQSIP
jgi:hypothetical protein